MQKLLNTILCFGMQKEVYELHWTDFESKVPPLFLFPIYENGLVVPIYLAQQSARQGKKIFSWEEACRSC